jgi:putative transposon-encoded protein
MPFGGDSFDHFRRGRQVRQFETAIRDRLNAANDEICKRIQSEEETEELQRKVVDEMREFFRYSTKLAAQVLADMQSRRAEEIETKLDAEIATFFEETKNHAMRVLAEIKQGHVLARNELIAVLEKPVKQVTEAAMVAVPVAAPMAAAPAALPTPVANKLPLLASVAKSTADAAKSAMEPAKPVNEIAKPAFQISKPAGELSRPMVEHLKPSPETAKPTVDSANPGAEAAKPAPVARPMVEGAKTKAPAPAAPTVTPSTKVPPEGGSPSLERKPLG